MNQQSMTKNATFNAIRTLVNVLFPFVTFSYASRVLQVDNIGKVNVGTSIIGYFLLLAALGISTYAVREGASIKNDRKKIEVFASEMFSINIVSTILAYLFLVVCLFLIPALYNYKMLIIVQSASMLFLTLGVDWINTIFEDFKYITLRSIAVQLISVVLLFLLVKKPEDYYVYAGITVFANIVTSVMNLLHVKKYCSFRFIRKMNLKRHILPIMIIFFSSIAVQIYVSADTTMLGMISGNYSAGIYGASSKIYQAIKQILVAVTIVSLPRLSMYWGRGEQKQYNQTLIKVINSLMLVMIPMIIGVNCVCDDLIIFVFGDSYLECSVSLRLLSIALIFASLGSVLTNAIILPMKMEKINMISTVISALVNILLNIWFIKIWQQNGAAFTTVIAELLVVVIESIFISKRYKINLHDVVINICKCLVCSAPIIVVCIIFKRIITNNVLFLLTAVSLSVVIYVVLQIRFKNSILFDLLDGLKFKKADKFR